MPFYEMAIIDRCENYRNFSHVPIRDFSVAENLKKHCGLYNKPAFSCKLEQFFKEIVTNLIRKKEMGF